MADPIANKVELVASEASTPQAPQNQEFNLGARWAFTAWQSHLIPDPLVPENQPHRLRIRENQVFNQLGNVILTARGVVQFGNGRIMGFSFTVRRYDTLPELPPPATINEGNVVTCQGSKWYLIETIIEGYLERPEPIIAEPRYFTVIPKVVYMVLTGALVTKL